MNDAPSPGSNEVSDSPRPAPDEPSNAGAPADSAELVSPFAALARGSPSAASIASRSSGAGSAADAALLTRQQQPQQGAAPSRLRALLQRVWRGFVRFVLWPLFGYDPSRIQGEWLPSDAYSARWVVGCTGLLLRCDVAAQPRVPGIRPGSLTAAHERSLANALHGRPSPLYRSFVARYGVLFETSRGPSVKYQ